jgi:hypothetical protein
MSANQNGLHQKAVETARARYEDLMRKLEEYEALRVEAHILESFLAQEEQFPGTNTALTKLSQAGRWKGGKRGEVPYHERIEQIMREKNSFRMSVREMVDEFNKNDWPIGGKEPMDTLRGTLTSKSKKFRALGRGEFELIQ